MIVVTGDIGSGSVKSATKEVADLIATLFYQFILTTGDNVYPYGLEEYYKKYFDKFWLRFRDVLRPIPGNHDVGHGIGDLPPGVETDYYRHFGASAGPEGLGYYSFEVGPWWAFALNSEIAVGQGSPQWQWLKSELEQHRNTKCQLAYWHRPLFSSGEHGDNPDMRDIWDLLQSYNVEIALTGHDHIYERFAPQNSNRLRSTTGLRQFIIGTGGAELYKFMTTSPNSESRVSANGVLQLRLHSDSYDWQFLDTFGFTRDRNGSSDPNTCTQ
jgi:hypothetical protein